ncbi:hypothetical protein CGJ15_25285 [Vibrio parahaemolyticus]|nr:hypothetical protein CGJ15_25285 [Vibrio parahaemolyticus]
MLIWICLILIHWDQNLHRQYPSLPQCHQLVVFLQNSLLMILYFFLFCPQIIMTKILEQILHCIVRENLTKIAFSQRYIRTLGHLEKAKLHAKHLKVHHI